MPAAWRTGRSTWRGCGSSRWVAGAISLGAVLLVLAARRAAARARHEITPVGFHSVES
ncbi:hypothetical protein [Actinomadura litoris]|uniref:hypothetical protein n=1 Tax=Actinomadura litoris TaxID=2678616 RepID=UPI001FA79C33|nr:hypothetical protein [Actinomadura litoris]